MEANYATIGQSQDGTWTYSEYAEDGEWIGTREISSAAEGEAMAAALDIPVNPQP